jgi:hypothetical protein
LTLRIVLTSFGRGNQSRNLTGKTNPQQCPRAAGSLSIRPKSTDRSLRRLNSAATCSIADQTAGQLSSATVKRRCLTPELAMPESAIPPVS